MFKMVKLEAAKQALARAHRVDEVKTIRDKADALRLYFKRQTDGLKMQNQAAELKLRAERKLGNLLAEMKKAKGGGDGSNQYQKSNRLHDVTGCSQTLAKLDISKMQSHRWQQVAAIPEDIFTAFVTDTETAHEELTTRGLVDFYMLMPRGESWHGTVHKKTKPRTRQYAEMKQGNALDTLKTLPDESVDMCITSPPYWSLRDYGIPGQLGSEETFQEYIDALCNVFDEVKRVLKPTGTCWVNMGDTYYGGGRNKGNTTDNACKQHTNPGSYVEKEWCGELPAKTLVQIPARFAIEMCDRGWILRNEIIWHKPNCMPNSVTDRFTVDYEKLYFFTKSKQYYFELQREPHTTTSYGYTPYEEAKGRSWHNHSKDRQRGAGQKNIRSQHPNGRAKRCVWSIATKPSPEAHFSVYPPELVETPIKAGCPELVCKKCGKAAQKLFGCKYVPEDSGAKSLQPQELRHGRADKIKKDMGYITCKCDAGFQPGTVLDPFMGSGTTALVAKQLKRNWIGIELSKAYVAVAEKRLQEHEEREKSAV